jgi:type IV secretory pathway VirB9-like protein
MSKLTVVVLAAGVSLLSFGCASQQPLQQPLPAPTVAAALAPPPPPAPPKVTGEDILNQQPREVQQAIRGYAEGHWPTFNGAGGILAPYSERMEPIKVTCAPNYVTDLYLLPDDSFAGIAAGDQERWRIGAATPNIVYIGCKDSAGPNNQPLVANASIFTTDGRTIPLDLRASTRTSLRWIRLYDPQGVLTAMRAADAAPPPTPQQLDPITPLNTAQLDCNYKIVGDQKVRPTRVCTDGVETWFDLPINTSLIAPVVTGPDKQRVNYTSRGYTIVVQTALAKAELTIANDKVEIDKVAR